MLNPECIVVSGVGLQLFMRPNPKLEVNGTDELDRINTQWYTYY